LEHDARYEAMVARARRAFAGWAHDRGRSLRRPILGLEDTAIGSEFVFLGIPARHVTGVMRVWSVRGSIEIEVWTDWEEMPDGPTWDHFAPAWCTPEPDGGAYVCSECRPGPLGFREAYSSLEDMWTRHVFDVFADWVDGAFSQAAALAFWGDRNRGTSCWLADPVRRPPRDDERIVPLPPARPAR